MADLHDATIATFAASSPVHLPHRRRVVTPRVLVVSTRAIGLAAAGTDDADGTEVAPTTRERAPRRRVA